MMNLDSPETAAYLLKREQTLYPRLLLQRVFQGTVSTVTGAAPTQSVTVVKTGETTSDGVSYPVISSWDPNVGDLCDIIWRDDKAGLAAFPISSGALGRIPARHPYRCKLYHSVDVGISPGWTLINYNSFEFDPSGMKASGDVVIPVSGTYLVIVHNRVIGFVETTSGLWWRPLGGASSEIKRGNYGSAFNDSELVVIRSLAAGDRLNGYVYVAVGNTLVGSQSSTGAASLEVCLLSR